MTQQPSDNEEQPTVQSDSETDERRSIDLASKNYSIYRCETCDNVVLTMSAGSGDQMACHGEGMQEITEPNLDIRPPDIRQVLLDAFGLPKAGLDICLCVIGEGPISPATIAEKLDYDESTIRKYLNELVEFGLLQRSQLNRETGGYVNVYHPIDIDEMKRETLVGFYAWAGEAASLIREANVTKEDYLDADSSEPLNEVFWEQFDTDSD